MKVRTFRPTHCPHGHTYQGSNLILQGKKRQCRECKRADWRRRYDREFRKPTAHEA